MPAWLKDAIFYEIYPQSFQDTNADGIGDIPGIIRRLDYIRELGCNALWLNPCFASPFLDAGYDVADYYTVAPRYGTTEDLKNLFAELEPKVDFHFRTPVRQVLEKDSGYEIVTDAGNHTCKPTSGECTFCWTWSPATRRRSIPGSGNPARRKRTPIRTGTSGPMMSGTSRRA